MGFLMDAVLKALSQDDVFFDPGTEDDWFRALEAGEFLAAYEVMAVRSQQMIALPEGEWR